MLSRGEQRAIIMVSLLLLLSLAARIVVQSLPEPGPPGMEEFMEESRVVMAELSRADSLRKTGSQKPTVSGRPVKFAHQRRAFPVEININTADSSTLLPLPGIGPVFAGRIIRYRKLLGGFYSPGQLSEVYGLSRETIGLITPLIFIDTSALDRLPVNAATFSELLRHPYLGYEDVKALVKYRDLMGPVSTLQGLRNDRVLPDSLVARIGPYLDFAGP